MFDYNKAFSRNIWLVSLEEQEKIKNFTIAIPGMGWVGSNHLIALVRQWFQNFKIADFDEYEIHNFNRQYWAKIKNIWKNKAATMIDEVLQINPDCKIELFDQGINPENIDNFLDGVDLSVDALDIFVPKARRLFFNKSHKKWIPVITAWPMGFSFAGAIMMPEGPNFDKYFCVDDNTLDEEFILHFALWLSPSLLHAKYMRNVSLKNKSWPSSIAWVLAASSFIVTNALRVLLWWEGLKPLPYSHQFDYRKNKYVCNKLLFWLNTPWQKFKLKIALKMVSKKS
jgi:hypothetical protein